MSESIDWPNTHPKRNRRRFFLFVALIVGVVLGSRAALSYYVDMLWFRSLGYAGVFWKTLSLQWTTFSVFAVVTFIVLYGSFVALKRAHLHDLPSGHTIFIGERPVNLPVEPVLHFVALVVSLAIAAATGIRRIFHGPA